MKTRGRRYWKLLAAAAVMGIVVSGTEISAEEVKTLNGNGVQVRFDEETGLVSLYGYQEDGTAVLMSRPSCISYPVIDGEILSDFTDFTCKVEEDIEGTAGMGDRMTVTSCSVKTGLLRICELESVDEVSGLLYVRTSYEAKDEQIAIEEFTDCEFALDSPAQTVWSYNGGGEGAQSYYDTLQKIDLKDNQAFRRDNRQDETSVGVPAADIYSEHGGIAVGDASAVRRELKTPVEEKDQTVYASVKRPSRILKAQEKTAAGEGFVCVHSGDYYMGLRGYADGMRLIGFETLGKEEIPESSYDLRWESWGWEFDWTLDLILGKLDELQALGIKQITLDDGWYNNAGEWDLNRKKLPEGDADMKRLTDEIHERGMTALLWWRPCDGGREASSLYKEHPDYFVKKQDGTMGKLAGPGASDSFNGTTGYALCPASEGAVKSQVDFVKKALDEWGFDGLKSDYVWSLPHCYNPAHHHVRPEESTEQQAVFYREIYQAMQECNQEAFHLLCNCGTPQDYYSLPYVTQVPTADPTSVDQTRRRVKAYKALCGDYFPVTTDHNEIWYPSAVGTGAVLIEKRNMTGSQQKEYERWLKIAQKEELQKGEFIGDLYSYGFDPYETYVVKKESAMYYAFYRDGQKYRPDGNPEVELKGLNPKKLYRIVDYVNDQVIATNVPGNRASFDSNFSSYLLLRAEELSAPDEVQTEVTAEEADAGMVFEGNWTAEENSGFSGGGSRYTTEKSASVAFAFEGDSIAWYGQRDVNFGTAEVYIDDVLQTETLCRGAASVGVKLYEKTGLSHGSHIIKIVCKEPVIDIDCFVYTRQSSEKVSLTEHISGLTSFYEEESFAGGEGWETFAAAKRRMEEMISEGAADQGELAQAAEQVIDAMLGLRKAVRKELIGIPVHVPEDSETEPGDIGMLYRVMVYAENLDMEHVIPAVHSLYQEALEEAEEVFCSPDADQNRINRACANLLDKIQYAGYVKGDKGELSRTLTDCRKTDLSAYQNPEAFSEALLYAERLLLDENALDGEIRQAVNTLLAEKAKLTEKEPQSPDGKTQVPSQVKEVKVKPQSKGLLVTWKLQADARSYTVYIQKNGKWQTAGTTAENSLNIKKLKAAGKYQIKVAAWNEKGTGKESAVCYTAVKPQKPKIKSVKNYESSGLRIVCKKRGETGFEVWVKKGKKAYKKAASGSKTVVLKKGIRMKGKVSVKIRGYVKNKNTKVYGAFRQIRF